ncbi:MazG family protein [Thermosinus carboxydivorans Nor1]|uniref:MazG family protein n=1 Tax=Thermosinus carboxydivorans Nor1 TaxID=401526 RepID=A1HRU6_9FIRM|nr:nucleoside triphosphate pyrophosphohydrolase [Thermosinus carboxydivorans]EAX47267.1 MazG family protein [Thermosinus carboxydivorans Nor1]
MGKITIVGLGPGALSLLTVEAWDTLRAAQTLLLRTARHPCVDDLARRGLLFTSYDAVYDEKTSFEEVYRTIAADVVSRAAGGEEVVFAVPGSPLVAERAVALIREQAKAQGIPVAIVPGMSFLEVLYTRLGIDPIHGLTVVDAAELDKLPPDLPTGLVVTQVYNRQVASETKLTLMDYFGDDYPVTVVQSLSLPDEQVRTIPLYELDRLSVIDHLTSVYVPPRPAKATRFNLDPIVEVMATLRSPGGCVWDIEQTHASLRRYLVEEVYEVLEAIDLADADKLCEELGDLLLQIVFHARIAEESGAFSMQDVIDGVTEKMIRRHPHVFGDITVRDAAEVVLNWEKIKKQEKGGAPASVLAGIPNGLPSLMQAYKLQAKAAKVGFDWDDIGPVWAKIDEELAELRAAVQSGKQSCCEDELGDVLFAVVNLARFLDIDPETALNHTNNKFRRRFAHIEETVAAQGLRWQDLTLAELDRLWEEAKAKETGKNK